MFINIIFSLFAVFSPVENNENETKKINAIISEVEDPVCMDRLMTEWFVYFNKAQERGHEMQRADEIASAIALERYRDNCNHR